MSINFWQTPMGRTFFDSTMPALVRELVRLNENLERLVCTLWDGRVREAQASEGPDAKE